MCVVGSLVVVVVNDPFYGKRRSFHYTVLLLTRGLV